MVFSYVVENMDAKILDPLSSCARFLLDKYIRGSMFSYLVLIKCTVLKDHCLSKLHVMTRSSMVCYQVTFVLLPVSITLCCG